MIHGRQTPACSSHHADGGQTADGGLTFCTSDGTVYENPRYLARSGRKLKREQKKLSRRQKGSNRYNRQRQKVNRLHAKVRHQRQDQIHKMTTGMTERYDESVIEDLNVSGMVKNHKLARSICDAGFHQIRRMLEYKWAQKGRKLSVTD